MFVGSDFTKYVDFIREKSGCQTKPSERHHILPKAIWSQYTSLRIHKWNCAVLSPGDHVLAHIIFYETVETHENFQAIKRLKKYITSPDIQERYERIALNAKKSLEQQRLAGKNKLYKDADGNHISDNMLVVVDIDKKLTQISCDGYEKFKTENEHIPKHEWRIVAVLSPEGQERLIGVPYTSPTSKRVSVISRSGETKSITCDEYNTRYKMSKCKDQEWVPVISTEGLRRQGKESKHHTVGKVCVFDIEKQCKDFVIPDEYAKLKNTRYILWKKYKKTLA